MYIYKFYIFIIVKVLESICIQREEWNCCAKLRHTKSSPCTLVLGKVPTLCSVTTPALCFGGCDNPTLWCRLGMPQIISVPTTETVAFLFWNIFFLFLCLGFAINQIIWLLSQSFNIKQFILAFSFYDQWKALNQSCQQCCFYLRLTMINENVYDLSGANFSLLCQVLPTVRKGDFLWSTLCTTGVLLTKSQG